MESSELGEIGNLLYDQGQLSLYASRYRLTQSGTSARGSCIWMLWQRQKPMCFHTCMNESDSLPSKQYMLVGWYCHRQRPNQRQPGSRPSWALASAWEPQWMVWIQGVKKCWWVACSNSLIYCELNVKKHQHAAASCSYTNIRSFDLDIPSQGKISSTTMGSQFLLT